MPVKNLFNRCKTAAAVCLSVGLLCGTVNAADHADGPSLQSDDPTVKQLDANDLYAFINPSNEQELVLMLTVFPDAAPDSTFSTTGSYNFMIQNYDGTTPGAHLRIRCQFPTTDQVSCALGDLVTSGAVGQSVEPGNGLRIFAGLRDDPFFFNGGGLAATAAAGSPQFTDPQPENPGGLTNSFANMNILALVLGVDKNLLTANQTFPILRVWAATETN